MQIEDPLALASLGRDVIDGEAIDAALGDVEAVAQRRRRMVVLGLARIGDPALQVFRAGKSLFAAMPEDKGNDVAFETGHADTRTSAGAD